ncbi:DUF1818 family protein [Leptolyngbya cf. ectocarpi LEGE 11479]|uniref:DUF1818 family protein n=1 Tax=Leptolyngbya cf. ectocarpi LEGE 11479 TaxID=1828722 RepID=A0A928ZVZ7_LEPEC|nr:DUF1818 family protein [Leptolyngbya ectocarpi]MBE9068459.1 DUF1818 family protein [Leptolyngbya cf. ectocarpi LEGE 11479]
MTALLKEGSGWRLGWDQDRTPFQALVGGESWAIELTQEEFETLGHLAKQLAATMTAMASELMPDERITLEQETQQLWMEADGFHHSYSLRFIVLTGRGAEGTWPTAVVPDLLNGLDSISVF